MYTRLRASWRGMEIARGLFNAQDVDPSGQQIVEIVAKPFRGHLSTRRHVGHLAQGVNACIGSPLHPGYPHHSRRAGKPVSERVS